MSKDKEVNTKIRLTQFSHGAGCGCKIAPAVLDQILHTEIEQPKFEGLLVGNEGRDDAAVFDHGNGRAIISTTDFFMPIVDDPYDFGRIAAANAISDIYAMGGNPMMAIAILGWPIDKLGPEVAAKVLEGGRSVCKEAGIPLAGGHSIDCPEPVFGLAVTGDVATENLKENSKAESGNLLFLTKPLGIGILSTAQKNGSLSEEDFYLGRDWMVQLNSIGKEFGNLSGVKAMTDVTGFGLLGHLSEMADGSNLSATIEFDKIPVIKEAIGYLKAGSVPGGTKRNLASYGDKIGELQSEKKSFLLADPQTSGGLLVAVAPESLEEFGKVCAENDLNLTCFGKMVDRKEKSIYVY